MQSRDALCNDSKSSSAGEPTETDYTAVGCAITTISSNLTEMSKGVKLLAALMDDEVGSGHKLMGAARMLAGAVSDLLRSVEPAAAEVRRQLIIHGNPSSHKNTCSIELPCLSLYGYPSEAVLQKLFSGMIFDPEVCFR